MPDGRNSEGKWGLPGDHVPQGVEEGCQGLKVTFAGGGLGLYPPHSLQSPYLLGTVLRGLSPPPGPNTSPSPAGDGCAPQRPVFDSTRTLSWLI